MPDYSRIRAVVFDAVGTVMYPNPSVPVAYRDALQRHCEIRADVAEIATVLKRSLSNRSAVADLSTNEEIEHQFWADLIHELCPNSPGFNACFDDLFHHFAQPRNWICFPDVAGTLSSLSKRKLTVAIASNFDRRLNSVCDGLEELSPVRHRVISSIVGWRKPAREFFDAVLETLQLDAEQVMMVGDDITNDVTAALKAGMPAVLINRSESTFDLPAGAACVKSLSQLTDVLDDLSL